MGRVWPDACRNAKDWDAIHFDMALVKTYPLYLKYLFALHLHTTARFKAKCVESHTGLETG